MTEDSSTQTFMDIATSPYKSEIDDEQYENAAEDIPQEDSSHEDTLDTAMQQDSKDDAQSNPFLNVQSRRIRCTECFRFTAETEEKMMRHVRKIHRGENPFQCSMCDYSTYNKAVFEEHVRIHQGIKPFKCNHCPYRSASKKNTKKHELIHRPNNPNRCDQCGFIARHVRGLISHKKTHTTELSKVHELIPQCVDCKTIFNDYNVLQVHRSHDCDTAKRRVFSKKKRSVKPQKQGFVCAICKWVGNFNKPRILLHLIHHPKQKVDESFVDVGVLRSCGIMVGV